MMVKNYFADIMGINIQYALETYDWQGFYLMTDNGITVTGFWDKRKGVPDSKVYELDERGLYVRKD
jgi:putative methionine-R-sulfoxide reductase with GAF domain